MNEKLAEESKGGEEALGIERVCVVVLGCVQLFATLWTIACQAPLSMGFSRKDYWSELPFPSLGDLPDPGIKPISLTCVSCTGRGVLYH